ncbi:site-specific integrase, partial [Enterococcus faecium]|nr:site-specific integrase [Enterococcus faecium]
MPPDQERKCAKSYGKVGLFVVPYFTISKSTVQPNKRTKGKIKMAKREIDKRIKSYLTKKNETKYMFYIYAGVDPMTGKKRKVKKMGFKSALEADRALRRIETQVKNEGADSVKVKQ